MAPDDQNSELFVNNSDPVNSVLITQKLNGENYGQWSRSAKISLIAKNKLGSVNGEYAKPTDASKLLKWERCDNLVMS